MHDLQQQIDRLARTTDPAEAVAARERIAASLDRSERELTVLLDGLPKPPALPAVVARDAAAAERAR
jgi:predicted transcriptional regulator